jgi:hypothetical protein
VFKFVAIFAFLSLGVAHATEAPQHCLPEIVNTHQVLVTGEYAGKAFAYTITTQSKARPDQQATQAKAQDKPCPLTS